MLSDTQVLCEPSLYGRATDTYGDNGPIGSPDRAAPEEPNVYSNKQENRCELRRSGIGSKSDAAPPELVTFLFVTINIGLLRRAAEGKSQH